MAESILGPIDVNLNNNLTGKLTPLENFPLLPIPYKSRATKGYASGLNYKFIAFNSHRSLQASELNEIEEHAVSAKSLNLRFNANWKNSDYGKVPFWSGIMPLSPDQVIAEQPQVVEANKLLFTFVFKRGWYLVARNNTDGLNRWVYFPRNIDVQFEYVNNLPAYTVYLGFNAHHPFLKCCSNVANCNELTGAVSEDNGWPTHSSEFLDNSQDYLEDQNAYTCGGDREFFAIKDDPFWEYNEGSGFFGVSNTFLGDGAPLCMFKLIRTNDNYELIFLNSNEIIYSTEFVIQNLQQANNRGSFYTSVGTNSSSGAVNGLIDTNDASFIKISTITQPTFQPYGRARLINESDEYGFPEPDNFDAKTTKTAKYSADVQVDTYPGAIPGSATGLFNSNTLIVGYFTTHSGININQYLLPIEKGVIFRPSENYTWATSFFQQVNNTNAFNPYQEHDFFVTTISIYDRVRLKVILDDYGTKAKWYINDALIRELDIATFANIPIVNGTISNVQNFIYSVSNDSPGDLYRTYRCYAGCEVRHKTLALNPDKISSSLKIYNSVFETKQS